MNRLQPCAEARAHRRARVIASLPWPLVMPAIACAQHDAQAANAPRMPAVASEAGVHSAGVLVRSEVLVLDAGAQQELLYPGGIERIAIGDERVAQVVVARQQPGTAGARLILTGGAPGTTSLMVWEKGRPSARRYELTVQRKPAVVEGRYADVQAHAVARARVASAHPDTAEKGEKAELEDRSSIDVRSHTVQVDVKVVEFNRNTLKQVGLNIFSTRPNSHGFSFGVFSPASVRGTSFRPDGGISGTYDQPLAQALNLLFNFGKAGIGLNIGLLEGNGLARVLAEPTLVAMSGQSASFLAGGELPIPVPQGLGTTSIEYKPFGVGLTVTPTVMSNERIALKVAPEASDLDYANALSLSGVAVPAITTRRADTTVELGDGESFVIGGLVSRSTASNVNKVPLLGDLPVLGSFFRKNSYQISEKELAIVVTPHLVRPLARGTDLQGHLPAGEQRDAPVWRQILLGGAADTAVPGFSQ